MSYFQENLQGSGTPEDPFLINSYSDWKIIDARAGLNDPPPHYKLTTDIDMYSEHEPFQGADFLGGTLWMDNHSILNPKIKVDGYCIRFCTVIGGDLETLYFDGHVKHIGGEGKITNITGTKVKTLFHKCYFKRMFIEIDATDMWIDDSTVMSLTGQIASVQTFIRITNDGINDKPLIATLPLDNGVPFKDTCFEFFGNTFDYPLIDKYYDSESDAECIMQRCMVCGDIDCSEMSWYHDSDPAPYMVDGGISSCVFTVNAKGARDGQGYRAYTRYIYDTLGPSIAVNHSGLYVGDRAESSTPITRVDERTFKDPDILKDEYGFEVLRTR